VPHLLDSGTLQSTLIVGQVYYSLAFTLIPEALNSIDSDHSDSSGLSVSFRLLEDTLTQLKGIGGW
jgi:hypothetical protein